MVQVLSKLLPISVTCQHYVHPWTDSCLEATAGLYIQALIHSLRIYGTVYTVCILFISVIFQVNCLEINCVFFILKSS